MINVSKKILALIMSMLMVFSCMAVSASAADTETIQIIGPVCEFDLKTMTITVAKPENINYGDNNYPVDITIAPADGVEKTVNADGSIVFSGVVLETKYTVTATLVDNVADDVTVTGTASATVTPTITVPGTKNICTYDEVNRTITVDTIENVQINGKNFASVIVIEPAASSMRTEEGKKMFYNLEYGKTYTVKAFIQPGADAKAYYSEDNFTVTVKNKQEAPAAPVPAEITSTSITVTAVSGCQYIIRTADGKTIGYDWADSTGKDAIKFADLSAETYYVIAAKRKATDTHYESSETTITVRTKAVGKGEAAVPVLEDKTNTTITVVPVDGVEYSINGGKTWQASNEFTGLTANTQYEIIARYTYDSKTEDPSTASTALVVKTNASANYEAKKANISFSATVGDYADSETKFTVKGDGPADMNNVQYGDTRIIPVSYKVVFGTEEIKASTAFTGVKVTNTGSFTAPDHPEKVVTVKVTFAAEEYKGKDADGNAVWEETESFTESYDVTMSRANTAENKAKGVLEVILNFLLNTIPAFFAQAFQSDVWARLFKALGDLGKAMG